MKASLLLVDDDPSVSSALGNLLSAEGYRVVYACNGRAAISAMATHGRPGLVLLDLCMPEMGGWDTFERLTAMDPSLPIVVITARPDQQTLAAVAGVDALLEKPLNVALLLKTIRMLLAEDPVARRARIAAQSRGPTRLRSKRRQTTG
jgi:DNA-binding response OmpR family regulator